MATDKEDTDPSSPSALRPRLPEFEAAGFAGGPSAGPVDSKPTTDPGLGPPSGPPGAPTPTAVRAADRDGGRRLGVTVPPPSARPGPSSSAITPPEFAPLGRVVSAPATAPLTKDSVELLLEGMAGPRPDRRKTTPQSDGEASAAYHAEHGVRQARTSSEPAPKVLVDRPVAAAPPSSPRVAPSKVRVAAPVAEPAGSREAVSTYVPARALRRRVAMAVLAGALIVLLSFVGLQLTAGPAGSAASAGNAAQVAAPPEPARPLPPSEPVASAPVPISAAPPAPEPPAAPRASAHESAKAGEPRAGDPRAASHAAPTRPHGASASTSAGSPGDLGEFKPSF